jgi:hypothetical protein
MPGRLIVQHHFVYGRPYALDKRLSPVAEWKINAPANDERVSLLTRPPYFLRETCVKSKLSMVVKKLACMRSRSDSVPPRNSD